MNPPGFRRVRLPGIDVMDGLGSYANQCSPGSCVVGGPDPDPADCTNVGGLKCWQIADFNDLDFEWFVDGVRDLDNGGHGVAGATFTKFFFLPAEHTVNLKVSYTF